MTRSNISKSQQLFSRARQVIPGGVNSPVRAFKAVGGQPLFIKSAGQCWVEDVDGNRYIDYVGSWGPLILGHAHPAVLEALKEAAGRGWSYGAPTELEVLLAEKICQMVPSINRVRLVNSGTEATMSAVRLARAYSGRPFILKFDGCYHGHGDSFLVKAGSGVATLNLPDSPGVPEGFAAQTISIPFNNQELLDQAFQRYGEQLAGVILEPVTGNMGVIVPERSFLDALFRLAREYGALVIFDEVMTGFRLARGGAQELFSVQPDLTTLGKIAGGGLPLAAFGGRREIMEQVAPEGPVYQAGTLSGNPLAVTAGLKTLEILDQTNPYLELEARTERLCAALTRAAEEAGIPLHVARCGSMFTGFFTDRPVRNFDDAKRCNLERFSKFFNGLLERSVYIAPSQFEASFVSVAHTDTVIDETVEQMRTVLRNL